MTIAAIVARLKTGAPALRLVDGLTALSELVKPQAHALPAAYVVPQEETPRPNRRATGGIRQPVTVGFGVVLGAREVNRKGAATPLSALDAVKSDVHGALIGWYPPGADMAVEYAGGRLFGVRGQVIWWLARYRYGVDLIES